MVVSLAALVFPGRRFHASISFDERPLRLVGPRQFLVNGAGLHLVGDYAACTRERASRRIAQCRRHRVDARAIFLAGVGAGTVTSFRVGLVDAGNARRAFAREPETVLAITGNCTGNYVCIRKVRQTLLRISAGLVFPFLIYDLGLPLAVDEAFGGDFDFGFV